MKNKNGNRGGNGEKRYGIVWKVVRYSILISLSTLCIQFSTAQDDLSKQLEVTRAYTPHVSGAVKLPIVPDMTDTVKLRPEISYRITSTASTTSFETRPFEAADISAAPFELQRPFYLRAGFGAPFSTEADLYYTPRMKAGRTFGLFANHSGSFSNITNDLGIEADATEMENGAGVWGTRQWSRYSLEGDITYENRLYNPYGASGAQSDAAPATRQVDDFIYDRRMGRFTLGLARAGVSFGDNFSDLSRFNFRVALDGGYAQGSRQANFDVKLTAARMLAGGKHGFEVALAERGAFDADASVGKQYGDAVTLTFAPRYLLSADKLSVRAGVDVRYIKNKRYLQDRVRVAPSVEISANFAGGAFVPYFNLTSQVANGDHEALSRRNPYVQMNGTTGIIHDARIGFSGDLNDVFSYKVAGGISMFNDYQLFMGTRLVALREIDNATGVSYDPMWFEPVAVDGSRFTAGAQVSAQNLGGFGARLYGNWNNFEFVKRDDRNFDPVGDLPKFDLGLELSYRFKDIFSLRLGTELIGERQYLVRAGSSESGLCTKGVIAPVVNVTFGADVKIAHDFWVFLDGKNLANQVLYPYPHYRGLGTSFLAGIKLVF